METPLWMDTWTASAHSSRAATAAQQMQQQRQRKGAVVGVGRLNTSTYDTVYSTIGRFIIHRCSIIGSLAY